MRPTRWSWPALCLLVGCAPPRQVSDSGLGAFEVSLAAWADGLALAWYDTRDGNAEVYVRPLDASGGDAGPELRITTNAEQSYEADIAALEGAFAIAWYERGQDASSRAQLGVWLRDGTPVWSTQIGASSGDSRTAVVRSYGDALFCAWIEDDTSGGAAVWGGWWGLDGRLRAAPVVLGTASANTWNLNAAIDDSGAALVVFDAQAGTRAEELFLATLADGHVTLAQLSTDDGVPSKYPDIALTGADAALTWYDERDGNKEVYLAVGSITSLSPLEPLARRVTNTPGQSIGAYVAWNRQRIGLAWSDDSGGNYEVYFQSFDAANYPQGSPRRLTDTPTHSLVPAIEPWQDGFAIAWDEVEVDNEDLHDPSTRAEVLFTTVM